MENTYPFSEDITSKFFQPTDLSNCILKGYDFMQPGELLHTHREYYFYSGHTGPAGPSGILGGIKYVITTSPDHFYRSNHDFQNNPTFNLTRGHTYYFDIQTPGHPFWITSSNSRVPLSPYSKDVSNNGTDCSMISFTVPLDAPNQLYYNCENNDHMCGIICVNDMMGCTGPTGDVGPTGPANGLTGPTGPVGPTYYPPDITFISVFNTKYQSIPSGNPVLFETCSSMNGATSYTDASSSILIWKPGSYLVSFHVYHIEGCQFSLVKNNSAIVPGSTVGTITGSSQCSNTFIMDISSSDFLTPTGLIPYNMGCKLELVNQTQYIPNITLYDASSLNYTVPLVNVNLSLYQIQQ